MKNKKGKQRILFNYAEEYKTSNNLALTEEKLKTIFNEKYFKYIKRNEKKI